ncbi:glycosyltransferase family 2 protein, partial [Blautia sp. MSK22_86]|nr:glycosyltransferase family 2 protein [Blautia sp. MSK22_86]
RYNLFKIRYSSRHNIYLSYKNMPVLQILLNLPAFILGFSAKLVFFASKGYGKEYLAGIKNGFFICRKP